MVRSNTFISLVITHLFLPRPASTPNPHLLILARKLFMGSLKRVDSLTFVKPPNMKICLVVRAGLMSQCSEKDNLQYSMVGRY